MCLALTSLTLVVTAFSQAAVESPADDAIRKEKQQFLKEKSVELSLFQASNPRTPLPLYSRPVLFYSNPVGLSSDGATFLWLAGKRPVAAVSFSLRRPSNAVYRECTSLWSDSLDCRQGDASVWAPKKGGLLAQRLSDAPAPADGAAQRMAQMRTMARRFAVTWHHSRTNETTQLSLMPGPLYRFEAENDGILDGALFAFVVTNDPEMLLLLEAARDRPGDAPYWRYTFARMSSLKEVVRLDDQDIWTVPHYHSDPTDDKWTGHYTEQAIGRFVPANVAPANERE